MKSDVYIKRWLKAFLIMLKKERRKISEIYMNDCSITPQETIYVYAENYGCTANKFDMEVMLGQLIKEGYRLSADLGKADILIINTCGVKKPTEDRVVERIRYLSRLGKPLIIAGCLPRINIKAIQKVAPNFAVMLDPRSVDRIVDAARLAQEGKRGVIFFSDTVPPKLDLPIYRVSKVIGIIMISEGCLGNCAYCCVRFARGKLHSFPMETIVKMLKEAVSDGVKEIWLTSQDCGAYGADINTNLAELLRECCEVPGRFLIRVGMMNPRHVLKILPELVDSFKNKKIFNFLHLPVQSGDDEVLRRMNRGYSVREFKEIVEVFRKEVPKLTLATDVICGFPGEDSRAFENTIRLIEEVKPDIVNISRFFPRPRTPAEKMKHLDVKLIKSRSRRLSEVVRRISWRRNEEWIGWEGEILVDEKGRGSSWIGRNFAYKPIVVKSNKNLIGRFLKVRVTRAFTTYLEADILETKI